MHASPITTSIGSSHRQAAPGQEFFEQEVVSVDYESHRGDQYSETFRSMIPIVGVDRSSVDTAITTAREWLLKGSGDHLFAIHEFEDTRGQTKVDVQYLFNSANNEFRWPVAATRMNPTVQAIVGVNQLARFSDEADQASFVPFSDHREPAGQQWP